jgi:hypothetical protein
MISAGVDAVLIKVAGIGLLPKHLGMSLKEMEPMLQSLVRSCFFDFVRAFLNLKMFYSVLRMICMALTSVGRAGNTRL